MCKKPSNYSGGSSLNKNIVQIISKIAKQYVFKVTAFSMKISNIKVGFIKYSKY